MNSENKWIEIPMLLNYEEFLHIEKHLTHLGINYESKTVTTRVNQMGAEHSYSVYVAEEHAPAAAIAFRHFLDINDPAGEQPFTGTCPACGERITGVWTCPSCEISFRPGYDKDDPIIVFIRQYGGFDDPRPGESSGE